MCSLSGVATPLSEHIQDNDLAVELIELYIVAKLIEQSEVRGNLTRPKAGT